MPHRPGLSSLALKLIAIAAMTADHIGWQFVPLYSAAGFVLHFIGRLTAPVMAFFIAEGYYHTKNLTRYAARLGIFALLSHLPFRFYQTGTLDPFGGTGVQFTLLLGLLALVVAKHPRLHFLLKGVLIAGLLFLSQWSDWSHYGVLWVLVFGLLRGKRRPLAFAASGALTTSVYLGATMTDAVGAPLLWLQNTFHLGGLLSLALLSFYNGKPGRFRLQYFFYLYYPLHLILIRLLV